LIGYAGGAVCVADLWLVDEALPVVEDRAYEVVVKEAVVVVGGEVLVEDVEIGEGRPTLIFSEINLILLILLNLTLLTKKKLSSKNT